MASERTLIEGWSRQEQGILKEIETHLATVEEMVLSPTQLNQATSMIAGLCLALSKHLETKAEKKQSDQLSQLMNDDLGQLFSTLLTDRVPRLADGADVTRQARNVLSKTGVPASMPLLDQCQLMGLKMFGTVAPKLIGNAVRKRIRKEAQTFLMPGEQQALSAGVKSLKASGVQVNVNQLGEEVLGDIEARKHMDAYLELLNTESIDTISVKSSSICAQLSVLAFDTSLHRICDALRELYRAARGENGQSDKLVMLDMEAYRDLEMTFTAFKTVLDEPEFLSLKAGIVLQAYLPDSHDVHQGLIEWAKARRARGGSAIQLRLVKGANLAVEKIESDIAGWSIPIFPSKTDVDASFKLMVERALTSEHLSNVKVGIASHNLFDVAYALCLTKQRHLTEGVHFEVLSGMAGGLSRVLLGLGCRVLVYSPAVTDANLHAAVAYLVRRLDENTADQNFLRHSFNMSVGDDAWLSQERGFVESRKRSLTLSLKRRRRSRLEPARETAEGFSNAPDTDFTLRENRTWLAEKITTQHQASIRTIRSSHYDASESHVTRDGYDPSAPNSTPYTIELATCAELEQMLTTAAASTSSWSTTSPEKRVSLLRTLADHIELRRGEIIAALMLDGGKAVIDADAEVSEAIDFCRYYAHRYNRLMADEQHAYTARGVTVVTPPWNFPFAIPLGGVAAALVTGNPVILKPAIETPYIAHVLFELCQKAGIPGGILQFVVTDDETATPLITDSRVKTVVLTGGTSTAHLFKRIRPDLHLLAETGGKNATIVSHFADQDLAINAIIQSAFGHAGQKCSATSLLIITDALAQDSSFRSHLIDAAKSMSVGPAWSLDARVTPLINPPQGDLLKALTTLDEGESWWLEPKVSPENPRLWSPGIKGPVQPGSFSHLTEFFGPVLSVMVAKDLSQAIEWANATPYGLTAGFHSLDESEQRQFLETMNAGNLYVNRTTTGAIVQRQPFGGRKASCFGPGAKAGGPNYLKMFVHQNPIGAASLANGQVHPILHRLVESWRALSFELTAAARLFSDEITQLNRRYDPCQISGQDNLFRYQFSLRVLVLAFEGFDPIDLARVHLALAICGNPYQIIIAGQPSYSNAVQLRHVLSNDLLDTPWDAAIDAKQHDHIRILGTPPETLYNRSTSARCIDNTPVCHGIEELRKYTVEQSISLDYHRYGHLGLREKSLESVVGTVTPFAP
ncbi:MAG: bifunctional proline dehydrogenase/L-glutamate gamma-semialdehyde dehydrogenase [Bradymonadia bacterium]